MVNDFMHKAMGKSYIANRTVSEYLCSILDFFQDRILKSLTFHIWNYLCANLTQFAVEHPHDNRFASGRPTLRKLLIAEKSAAFVHIANLAADESLIYFDRRTIFTAISHLRCIAEPFAAQT